MSMFEWKDFLIEWSEKLLTLNDIKEKLPPEVISSQWMGFPGATEDQLVNAEMRLGTKLPPSYREFLKVSNGWRQTTPFIDRLWSTEEINWFAVKHQKSIDGYTKGAREGASLAGIDPFIPDEEYFVYGDQQDTFAFRVEYLQTALEISESSDNGIFLLNPQVVTPEGEWEAWFLAGWFGAARYRSFWEMMQAEYQAFLTVRM